MNGYGMVGIVKILHPFDCRIEVLLNSVEIIQQLPADFRQV